MGGRADNLMVMNKRLLSLLAVCALALAACGDPDQSGPTTPLDAPDAALLSYSLEAGDEFQYEVGINQHIDVEAAGDTTAMGEELPGSASVDIAGTGTFTHTVAAGPEDGTYEIHITGDFQNLSVTGTVDGEPVDSREVPDFAAMEPIDKTVVVDEQGNVVSVDGEEVTDPMAGMFGNLGSMSGTPAPGIDPGQFFGPLFSDDEVTVGDTWSDEIETPGVVAEEPIVTSVTNTITGVEEVDGTQLYVIDTATSTSLIEFDLAEFFRGLFGAFAPEGATEEDTAEFEEAMSQLKFLMTIDETSSDATSRFDAEAGVVHSTDVAAASHITMDMLVPDEESGEMVGFQMDMTMDQELTYQLLSGPAA
jgi:hypothetical protein